MSGFFNPDNKLFSLLGKVFDLVMLNTVWLLLYVPFFGLLYAYGATGFMPLFILALLTLIVFVPSMTAMYYSIVKAIRHQRSYPVKEFFRSFKDNFRQGAIASLFVMAFAGLLTLDFYILLNPSETANLTYNQLLTSAVIAVSFFVVGTLIFFCPVISRFNMTLKNALKFSFGLSVKHIWCTLLSLLLWAATVLLIYLTGGILLILIVCFDSIFTIICEVIKANYASYAV